MHAIEQKFRCPVQTSFFLFFFKKKGPYIKRDMFKELVNSI